MKRIITFILSLTLLCFFTFPVFAADNISTNTKKSNEIGVTAQLQLPEGVYSAQTKDNKAEIVFADGMKITVDGVISDGLSLVVIPINASDTKAMLWFEDCMKNTGTNIFPMDIYLLDKDGNRVQPTGTITITITMTKKYTAPIICYLTTDGVATLMKSSVSGNNIAFTTDHLSYYVIAENPVGTPNPLNLTSPQTGNNSNIAFCMALLFASSAILTASAIIHKKRK